MNLKDELQRLQREIDSTRAAMDSYHQQAEDLRRSISFRFGYNVLHPWKNMHGLVKFFLISPLHLIKFFFQKIYKIPIMGNYAIWLRNSRIIKWLFQKLIQNKESYLSNFQLTLSRRGSINNPIFFFSDDIVIYYYVDHTCTFKYNTGLQRVTRLLAKSIVNQNIDIRPIRWNLRQKEFEYLNKEQLENLSLFQGPSVESINQFTNETGFFQVQPEHLNLKNCWLLLPEVTYINNYSINLTQEIFDKGKKLGLKIASIYYDSIPLKRKELSFNAGIHKDYMNSIEESNIIIPISHYSAQDFQHLPHKIQTITLAAESMLSPRVSNPNINIKINNENIILSVGSITHHKNQMTLVKAFQSICNKITDGNWKLVLIGNIAVDLLDPFNKLIRNNPQIEFIKNAPEEVLVDYYKKCRFTVFPSLLEGYGLPIVESLWFGKPCICANFGVMSEVASVGGTLQIDVSNMQMIEDAIMLLITNPVKIYELQQEAIRAKLKTWDEYGTEIINLLQNHFIELEKNDVKHKRIFWLGMHKVLVKTELVRLRSLGYEVFNPPYLSPILDQSAQIEWDNTQNSTLPLNILNKLANTNFFYTDLSAEIFKILNSYFGTIIVTITPHWLKPIINGYTGKIIYRVYGQHDRLSDSCEEIGIKDKIIENNNFFFVPHALECVNDEDNWLRKNEKVIPYCLTDDIFGYIDSWKYENADINQVAMTCPNISNDYFAKHYKYINKVFPQSYFHLYGAQLTKVNDSRIVGTLPREELLRRWIHSVAYVYTYNESRVCYLPPIEMMIIGAPVLFPEGCLLDLYFNGADTPARFKTPKEALEKIERIRSGDLNLIEEIISFQDSIWNRYKPGYVWPIFDSEIRNIIECF